jgi:hypothetical protein
LYAPFLAVLTLLEPLLEPWLAAAQAHPSEFSLQAYPYEDVAENFPDLVTGAFPALISCSTAFSSLMDMRYLFGWRLMLDRMLSGILDTDIIFLRLVLTRPATCLHADTYMGVKLPPELSPNMYHHFRVQGGWPTADNPLFDFIRPELVSFIGQRYEIIPIDVHPDRPAPLADTLLQTVTSASAKHHPQAFISIY